MPMTNEGSINGAGHKPKGREMDLVASHQRLLVGAALRTEGPILELGVGWYSTPLLHEIAEAGRRPLVTLDNNEDWLRQFYRLRSDWHQLELVGWWGEARLWEAGYLPPSFKRWGMCFVDNGQPAEREWLIRKLIGQVDVFVMHDTEERVAYGYDRLLGQQRFSADLDDRGMFEFQWTDRSQKAWTTVASNTIDVRAWFQDLPPVEPTVEVT